MQLVAWLLHPEPEWRCTLQDLQSNAWINQPIDLTQYTWDSLLPPEGKIKRILEK